MIESSVQELARLLSEREVRRRRLVAATAADDLHEDERRRAVPSTMAIMDDPWGLEQPPIQIGTQPLPPRLARLAEVQATGVPLTQQDPYADDFPTAEELPEVQALMREGWRPLDAAPLYCLLPAAWPVEHRAWIPDRLPRVAMGGTTDYYWSEIVAARDDDWHDDYPAERAWAVGLPDPPADRIWLLRSPWHASLSPSSTGSSGLPCRVATRTRSGRSTASLAMS